MKTLLQKFEKNIENSLQKFEKCFKIVLNIKTFNSTIFKWNNFTKIEKLRKFWKFYCKILKIIQIKIFKIVLNIKIFNSTIFKWNNFTKIEKLRKFWKFYCKNLNNIKKFWQKMLK